MTKRIAMWSGPRNISTTMMRSFENRGDTSVVDEPSYAHYLSHTGLVHPMQDTILAAQSSDWRTVMKELTCASPAEIFFQKHMTHHITEEMNLDWLTELDHFFLIRDPRHIVASYTNKMDTVTAKAIGIEQQVFLFDTVTRLTGKKPAVVDAAHILANPEALLKNLCRNLNIPFENNMLSWPSGSRDSDGVWAPHWYDAVSTSTGFRPPRNRKITLTPEQTAIVAETQPFYDYLLSQAQVS